MAHNTNQYDFVLTLLYKQLGDRHYLKDTDNCVQNHLEDFEEEINIEAKVKRCCVRVALGKRKV